MTKTVVFDLDDTLYLEAEYVKSGFKAVNFFLKKKFNIDDFFLRAWEKFTDGKRGLIFNQVLIDMNFNDNNDRLLKELIEVYRNHIPKIELLEDAKWALKYYSKIVPIALLSDGYIEGQINKANSLKIDSYFNKIYFTDHWGKKYWKPSTFVFKKVQKDHSHLSDKFVYISDNLSKDFIAPNKLGWESIHIRREFGEYNESKAPLNGDPNLTINSLFELKDKLLL
jgi:putative hydrolase of the HAD superfamily